MLFEYKKTQTLVDIETWLWLFNKPNYVFNIWIRMFLYQFLVVPMVQFIDNTKPKKIIWITMYVLFQAMLFYYTHKACTDNLLNFGSCMILTCECARMSMKSHSYFRTKLLYGSDIGNDNKYFIPKYLKAQGQTEKDLHIPNIKIENLTKELRKYCYFLFAPTLLYRDRYIKGPKTDYRMVIAHFTNFLLCTYYGFILFKIFIMEYFKSTERQEPHSLLDFSIAVFRSCLPAMFCLFLMFFGLLHSWFNAYAQLLRFPDRHFYEDWWTALEFGTYYRKWNIVVHEFLYYNIYLDAIRFTNEKLPKNTSQMLTFILSAIVHEWIIAVSLGYFYPILFVVFIGPGIILIRGTKNVTNKYLNIVFWMLMFFGTSLIMVLYSMEYYARNEKVVDKERWGYWYHVAPRLLLVSLENLQEI